LAGWPVFLLGTFSFLGRLLNYLLPSSRRAIQSAQVSEFIMLVVAEDQPHTVNHQMRAEPGSQAFIPFRPRKNDAAIKKILARFCLQNTSYFGARTLDWVASYARDDS
jgi:hypothetical protein